MWGMCPVEERGERRGGGYGSTGLQLSLMLWCAWGVVHVGVSHRCVDCGVVCGVERLPNAVQWWLCRVLCGLSM